jgi:hypothetical protein
MLAVSDIVCIIRDKKPDINPDRFVASLLAMTVLFDHLGAALRLK